jgi:VPS62-like protein
MSSRRLPFLLGMTIALAVPAVPSAAAAPLNEQDVVDAYAPVVWLYPREGSQPYNGVRFIAESVLEYHGSDKCQGQSYPGRGEIDVRTLATGGYKHNGSFPNCDGRERSNTADQNNQFRLDLADSARGGDRSDAPTWYEFVPRQAITFWFLYGNNSAPGIFFNHEGDWERVTFLLGSDNRATAVVFHQHSYSCRTSPENLEHDGGHPVVYSAQGTHASYRRAGSFHIREDHVPAAVQDHTAQGDRWTPRAVPVERAAWYGYAGRWGNDEDSPTGPSRFRHGADFNPDKQWPYCE